MVPLCCRVSFRVFGKSPANSGQHSPDNFRSPVTRQYVVVAEVVDKLSADCLSDRDSLLMSLIIVCVRLRKLVSSHMMSVAMLTAQLHCGNRKLFQK